MQNRIQIKFSYLILSYPISTSSLFYIECVVAIAIKMWVPFIVYVTIFSWISADESKFYMCLLIHQLI